MNAHRIIDANANRAREALRVMEDAARFVLDDRVLCEAIKRARHDLAGAVRSLPGGGGSELAWRDTPGDVGTSVSTASEMKRAGVREVVIAAGKRLSEALRSIEEYAKTLGAAGVAVAVEQLRYRAYDLEQRLTLAFGTGRARQWRLCVIVTEALCAHHPWDVVVKQVIEGGADCIQLREKTLESRELLERARRLVEIAHSNDVSVIVNDRVDIALLAGADGVHVGQRDLSVKEVRRVAGFDLLVGVSTTTIEQARAALRDGADYCGVGPVFATATKASPGGRTDGSVAGLGYVREYAGHEPALLPYVAIGGISPGNVGEVRAAGAVGVAVSSAVCGARDVVGVCRGLRATA